MKTMDKLGAKRVKLAAEVVLGDCVCRFMEDKGRGAVGVVLLPQGMEPVARREKIDEPEMAHGIPEWCEPWAFEVESLVQVRCVGNALPGGYAQGMTMRGGGEGWRFVSIETTDEKRVALRLERLDKKLAAWVVLRSAGGCLVFETCVENISDADVVLEMVSSFCLDGLTPFARDDAAGRLVLHRARSAWSAEGAWESRTLEELGLERSWQGHAVRCERFGQVGTLPVRGWFPCMVLEDVEAKVAWGAACVWPGSWQMEIYRRGDTVSVSGGLADWETGHWRKVLEPGGKFSAPVAIVAACHGGLEEAAQRLVAGGEACHGQWNTEAAEENLPVVFNEFCSSWGNPTAASLAALAQRLEGSGARYLVVDAGWYCDPGKLWIGGHGDWVPSAQRFPQGLKAAADTIRSHGLVPGIWFEPETAGEWSEGFHRTDWLLARDGKPVTVGGRRFWDLRKPEVAEWLCARVVDIVRGCGFGYVKWDYNETVGIGADGAESPGEGLRQQVAASQQFYTRLREALTGVVMEFCASGGQRMDAWTLSVADMVSFSDAHESRHIPLLAAAQHLLAAPRRIQIWAVLRGAQSERELRYVLANGFLGRLCLSGELAELAPWQWDMATAATAFYARVAPVLREGRTRIFKNTAPGLRHPEGGQIVVRTAADGRNVLVVAHRFGGDTAKFHAPLPLQEKCVWQKTASFCGAGARLEISAREIHVTFAEPFSGAAWLLQAVPEPGLVEMIYSPSVGDGMRKKQVNTTTITGDGL